MKEPTNSGSDQMPTGVNKDANREVTDTLADMAVQAGVDHTIIVEEKGSDYRVTKGQTRVKRDETVQFVNSTNGILQIQFAKHELFAEDDIVLQPDGSDTQTVRRVAVPSDGKPITYAFAIFCYGRAKFAKGHSMPIIILDKN